MEEILCSIHNYSKFSGYSCTFYEMAQSALSCGIDAVFTSDKNIYPDGHNQFFYRDGKRVLFVCGEELFDPLDNEKNPYLSLGIEREQFNRRPGDLQNEIRIGFPGQTWDKQPRHIELLNAEELLRQGIITGGKKFRSNIRLFDEIQQNGQRIVAISGTCSLDHTESYNYQELFSTVCNHIYLDEKPSGDLIHDKLSILQGIKTGRLYIAIDGLADASGFRFSAEGNNREAVAWPGDVIYLKNSITLKINVPDFCTCRLIRNGAVIKEWERCKQVPYTIYEPGNYRVECALTIRKNLYDWIFSNPIYVVKG